MVHPCTNIQNEFMVKIRPAYFTLNIKQQKHKYNMFSTFQIICANGNNELGFISYCKTICKMSLLITDIQLIIEAKGHINK